MLRVEAECVLARLLLRYPRITLDDLTLVRTVIEGALEDVQVAVTRGDLRLAVARFGGLWAQRGEAFVRGWSLTDAQVRAKFDGRIPEAVRGPVVALLTAYCREHASGMVSSSAINCARSNRARIEAAMCAEVDREATVPAVWEADTVVSLQGERDRRRIDGYRRKLVERGF